MVKTIQNLLDTAGLLVSREERPIDGKWQDRKRPDLKIQSGERCYADVVISTPTCKSYITKGSNSKGLVAAAVNELRKHLKYDDLAKREGIKLYPLAFESYGAWGGEAVRFFTTVSGILAEQAFGGTQSRGNYGAVQTIDCCSDG